VPAWLDGDWASFLLSLSSEDLARAEASSLRGLLARHRNGDTSAFGGAAEPPSSLRQLAAALDEIEASLVPSPRQAQSGVAGFGVKERKARQIAAFVAAVRAAFDAAEVRRVVDVGAGVGALTGELQRHTGHPSVGIELHADRVAAGRQRAKRLGQARTSFVVCDVRTPGVLAAQLRPGDLVVGLHACGRLGGDIVDAVATMAPSVPLSLLLVSCCLQGWPWAAVGTVREPQSSTGRQLGLYLPRSALKMANLGSTVSAGSAKAARDRLALRWLLSSRGVMEHQRMPLRGLRKRDLRGAFRGGMAAKALEVRGLPPTTDAELGAAERAADAQLPVFRRLELMSPLVGDLVELAVSFDRASLLEEAGLRSAVGRLFPRSASPRNLAVYAWGHG